VGTASVTTAGDVGGVVALLQGGIQLLSLGNGADGTLEWQMHERRRPMMHASLSG